MNSRVSDTKPSHNEPFWLQAALVLAFCAVMYGLHLALDSFVQSRQTHQIQSVHRR